MGTPGSGRKRTPVKDRFSAEDEALSNIAREAEARLAAKRAARAEARDIRMRELERQQRELDEKSDKQYAENYTRPSSRNSASATTPLSGNSSRRGSGDTSSLIDPDTSLSELRDLYDLKDQIQDVEGRYMQGLKELKVPRSALWPQPALCAAVLVMVVHRFC